MKISLTAVLLSFLACAGLSTGRAACQKTAARAAPPPLPALSQPVAANAPVTARKAPSAIIPAKAVAVALPDESKLAVNQPDVEPISPPPNASVESQIPAIDGSAESNAKTVADKIEPVSVSWPQDGSELKPDGNAVFGNLDNGLRYVILPTKSQPGRASLRLHIDAGSFMERDDEQGIAHFLEHMAFNGMKRFPAGETLEYFQRMGMSFGAHTNASTSFNATIYKLELPRAGEELTVESLKYFRDILDGMLLNAQEIEKERGVVLGEMTSSDTADSRTMKAGLEFILPKSLLAWRFPIGTAECIRTMPRSRFVDFYEAWYRPERATLVAVGDVNAAQLRKLIEKEFSDARPRAAKRPELELGEVPTGRGLTARWHSEQDLDKTEVSISLALPMQKETDSAARRRGYMIHKLANQMLKTRLAKLANAPGSVLNSPNAEYERVLDYVETIGVDAKCESSQATAVVKIIEQEVRRAAKHGFTEQEFAAVKASAIAQAEAFVAQAETREISDLADTLVQKLSKNQVFLQPDDELRIAKAALATVTKDDCGEAFRMAWSSADVTIFVQSNVPPAADADKQLIAAYRLSSWLPVSAPVDAAADVWAYTDFGPAGKIVERQEQKDLEIVQARFANNVRVNVKRTPFEKNTVQVQVNFGGGLLEAPADKPGLPQFTGGIFVAGGLQAHSLDSINRILADKNVVMVFGIGEDAFKLQGQCVSASLEMQLQMCAAYLTAPAFRPEAAVQYQQALDGAYAQLEHTPEGIIELKVNSYLRSGDRRFARPDRAAMRARTFEETQAWLASPLRDGYMEVSIVGDIDPEQALALVAKSLGALPQRAAEKPAFTKEREVRFPQTPARQEFRFTADAQRAVAFIAWPTADGSDAAKFRRLNILAEVLNDRVRVKVREELGASYTPEVFSYASDSLTDYGFIAAALMVEPKRADEIGTLVAEIAAGLTDGSMTEDEFDRAIKPTIGGLEQVSRNNGYWLNVLSEIQSRPQTLADVRSRVNDYKSMTKADIEALAKEYFAKDRAAIVTLTPEKAGAEKVSSAPAADTTAR